MFNQRGTFPMDNFRRDRAATIFSDVSISLRSSATKESKMSPLSAITSQQISLKSATVGEHAALTRSRDSLLLFPT